MKNNGNDKIKGSYYLGLVSGPDYVGWAATDNYWYRLLKRHGEPMWGTRLFPASEGAAERRLFRAGRRNLDRSRQRVLLTQMLFAEEVTETDPEFFIRLNESSLQDEDRTAGSGKNLLFNGIGLSDSEYRRKYPTIYHLRQELCNSDEPHDVRLVYLAVQHIMKTRGHFLYDISSDTDRIRSISEAIADLEQYAESEYGTAIVPADRARFVETISNPDIGTKEKKNMLKAELSGNSGDGQINPLPLAQLIIGATADLSALFRDESLADSGFKSFNLKSFEDNLPELESVLGDRMELMLKIKDVHDSAVLTQMLGGHVRLSDAKVALYEKNGRDLRLLKEYVRKTAADKYSRIFTENSDKLDNFVAYTKHSRKRALGKCTQDDFCSFLAKELPTPPADDAEMTRIFTEIGEKRFYSFQRSRANSVIPYQLNLIELRLILGNAEKYLPFLSETDADGLSVKDKLIRTFEFRVPYYVGPTNKNAAHHWAERTKGMEGVKIYPWNFEKVIDLKKSATNFIEELIGIDPYTGEPVLPRWSLLYSEYALLNEINPMRIDGEYLPADVKAELIEDLFIKESKQVTKKCILNYLVSRKLASSRSVITGIDEKVNGRLTSWHDFRDILARTGDRQMVESIIRNIVIFGDGGKDMLKNWLKENTHGLTEADIKMICKLKYPGWGKLSAYFLTGIYSADPSTGEAKTVMDMLRGTNLNLVQLLTDKYSYEERAFEHLHEIIGDTLTLEERLDYLYVPPAVRRSIRQTLRIVDEIVDSQKSVPERIFVQTGRGTSPNRRPGKQKDGLLKLYRTSKANKTYPRIFERLLNETEEKLEDERIYLYYTQFGKCAYTGEDIDYAALCNPDDSSYTKDHIFPKSKVRDNSKTNLVLVTKKANELKSDRYPIDAAVRDRMTPFWTELRKNMMISEEKFSRLIRNYELTPLELSAFVTRQLTESQQAAKALTTILRERYGDVTEIVYSRADNVNDFCSRFKLPMCSAINDLYPAKKAYLSIVVGNVYYTKFSPKFFRRIRSEQYSLNRIFDFDVENAWRSGKTQDTVIKYINKNSGFVTFQVREKKGALFDVNPKPAGNGQMVKKTSHPELSIDRYGGYGSISSAYYSIIECDSKKGDGRIVRFVPVMMLDKASYEKAPEAYMTSKGYRNPRVVAKKVPMDSVFEIDGIRYRIGGRSGETIAFYHMCQLAADEEITRYISNLVRFENKNKGRNRDDVRITAKDRISEEENLALYDWFLARIEACNTYSRNFRLLKTHLENNRDLFISFNPVKQCQILLETLKPFRTDPQTANFKEMFNGAMVTGRIIRNMTLKCDSCCLISQSVTGMYETKTDILHS